MPLEQTTITAPHNRALRCSHEIELQVLSAIERHGSKPFHLQRKVGLNSKGWYEYQTYLISKGFITTETVSRARYIVRRTALGDQRLSILKGACA